MAGATIVGSVTLGPGAYYKHYLASSLLTNTAANAATVLGIGGPGTLENAGTIDALGAGGFGVKLVAGGTVGNSGSIYSATWIGVDLVAGGTVSNTGGISSAGAYGVGVNLVAGGAVINGSTSATAASVSATGSDGVGIRSYAGSPSSTTITNYGTVGGSRSVYMAFGGTLTNGSNGVNTALLDGQVFVQSGSLALANNGTISGYDGTIGGSPIAIYAGGAASITNGASGSHNAQIDGEVLLERSAGTIVNNGTINGANNYAVALYGGGSLTNASGALLDAAEAGGVRAVGSTTIINAGTIDGAGPGAAGILLSGHGAVFTNATVVNHGLIEGAVGVNFGYGADFAAAIGTIDNFGTIAGSSGIAVMFGQSGETLKIEAGSTLEGAIGGFQGSDKIDLSGIQADSLTLSSNIVAGNTYTTVTALDAGVSVASFVLLNSTYAANELLLTSDGSLGTSIGLSEPTSNTISGHYDHTVVLSDPATQNPTTIEAGAYIAPGHGDGVLGMPGTAWTLTNYGSIQAPGGEVDGVALRSGGVLTNHATIAAAYRGAYVGSGGLISNASGALIAALSGYGTGVYTSGGATISNAGTITGSHAAVMGGGGMFANAASGLVMGELAGIYLNAGNGTVSNLGTIEVGNTIGQFNGDAINVFRNGLVINGAPGQTSALISVIASGIVDANGSGTVVNYGTMISGLYAVVLGDGGVVINGPGGDAAALIEGAEVGVSIAQAGTVSNAGSIVATNGVGVYLSDGGAITNAAGGLIEGSQFGVEVAGGAGTVVNAGTIAGPTAVSLTAGGRVVVDPGAVFTGIVSGGSVASTLELASGASAGSLSYLGTQFVNFASIAVDTGATWALSGNNTLASGSTLSNAGSLSFTGTFGNDGTLVGTNGTAISFGDTSSVLVLGQGGQVQGAIAGFVAGDTIDLAGIDAIRASLTTGNVLDVQEFDGQSLTLSLTGNFSGDVFAVRSDGSGGTDITVKEGPGDTDFAAHNGAATVAHNTTVNFNNVIGSLVTVGTNDTETVIAISGTVGTATATVDSSGDVTFTAPASGQGALVYTVTDQFGDTATGTLAVTVDPGPTTNSGTTTVAHSGSLSVLDVNNFINSDSLIGQGLPGDSETITSVVGPNGTLPLNSGEDFSYVPQAGSGTDTLVYTVTDQLGDTNTGTISVNIDPGPTLAAGTTVVGHSSSLDVTSFINSQGLITKGLTGDSETITSVTGPANTMSQISGGDFVYTPQAASGTNTLVYTVTDQLGDINTGTINVTIDPGPVAGSGSTIVGNSTTTSTDLTSFIDSLFHAGTLPGDIATLTTITASSGTVTLNNGDVKYTPPSGGGTDTLTYTVADQRGDTATSTVSITVDPGLVTTPGSMIVGHEKLDPVSLSANVHSPSGLNDVETFVSVSAAYGTIESFTTAGAVGYLAPGTMVSSDTLTYTVSDQYGDRTTGTFTLDIDPGPTVAATSSITVGHGQTFDITNLIKVTPGITGDFETVTFSTPQGGSVSPSTESQQGSTPIADFIYTAPSSGPATIDYTWTDQYGDSTTGTIDVTIDAGPTLAAGASATIIHNQSVNLSTLLEGFVRPGVTGDTETVTAVTSSAHPIAVTETAGVFYYAAPASGTDTLTYTVTDKEGDTATGTVSVNIDPAPTITAGTTIDVGHDQTITNLGSSILSLVNFGLAGDVGVVTSISSSRGSASVTNGGGVSYTAPSSGTDTLTYTVTDLFGETASGTIGVTVDSGPTLTTSASTTIVHGQIVDLSTILAGFVTPGMAGDTETVTAVTSSANPIAVTETAGVWYYAAPASGTDTLTYTVTDKEGDTATGTVSVSIDPAPVITTGTTIEVGHGQTIANLAGSITSLVNFGLPGDTETVTNISSSKGSASVTNGVVSYTAPSSGPDTLTYTVTDAFGDTGSGSISVTVDPGPIAGTGTTTLSPNQTIDLTSLIDGLLTKGLAGDTETITAVSATLGTATVTNGDVTYTAPASGSDTIVYTVKDELGDTATGTVDVTLPNSHPAPTASSASFMVLGGRSTDLTSYLLSLVTPGAPGDTIKLTGDNTTGTRGKVTLSNGDLSYVPPSSGTDSFGYTVSDQLGDTASANVTVTQEASTNLGNVSGTLVLGAYSGSINFGTGNVTVFGDSGNVVINGGNGTDVVRLGNGNDVVSLGVGVDLITMGNGNDVLNFSNGSGTITLGNGNDVVNLGAGISVVTLGNGNDVVNMSNGHGTVTLGNGNDVVNLGAGFSVVTMTNGNDVVNMSNGSGTVTLGTGNDVANLGAGVSVVSMGNGNDTVNMSNGSGTVTLGNGNDVVNLGSGPSSVTMGNGNDTLNFSNGYGTITLGNGNDVVNLGSGSSTVTLGNGNDTLNLGNGSDTVTLGTGSNTVNVGSQNNTITIAGSASSSNTINVGNGKNTLTLGAGKYTANVGSGSDTIILGNGNYNVSAGSGTDQFIYSSTSGMLTLSSFGSNDELVFRNSAFDLGVDDGHGTSSLQEIAASLLSSNTNGTFASTTNRFAYNASNGDLYYSATGSNTSKMLVGDFTSHPHLTAANLFFTS